MIHEYFSTSDAGEALEVHVANAERNFQIAYTRGTERQTLRKRSFSLSRSLYHSPSLSLAFSLSVCLCFPTYPPLTLSCLKSTTSSIPSICLATGWRSRAISTSLLTFIYIPVVVLCVFLFYAALLSVECFCCVMCSRAPRLLQGLSVCYLCASASQMSFPNGLLSAHEFFLAHCSFIVNLGTLFAP
jgi:hypothetical protein